MIKLVNGRGQLGTCLKDKLKFVEETNWKPKRDTTLFVRFPVCR